jgi:hypothetical protein
VSIRVSDFPSEVTPMDNQSCEICGKPNSPFGYEPPLHPESIWLCAEHRLEGPVPRLPLFPRFLELDPAEVIGRMVSEWVEANWPTVTDSSACRHCGRGGENLIPLGYGARPRIWLHRECSDAWRVDLYRKTGIALGLEEP